MDNLPNNKPCPHCGRYNNRAITIDALIIKNDSILLIKRALEPFKGYWALPGGHLEWDQTAEDAVRKEVKEETGLEVVSMQFLRVYTNPGRDPRQKITLAYQVTAIGDPVAGDDAKEYKWFELKNLPDLGFDHRQIIEDYLK